MTINTRHSTVQALGLFLMAALMLASERARSQDKAALAEDDRIRITEAFRLADSVQDRIWPNWNKAPFGLMLVTNDYEYLIGHPHATNNFDTLGFNGKLRSRVLYRKRLFPTNLLATFPAINGTSTIVVGQSSNTNASSSAAWVITILHEHFHQFQQSQPDYYSSVESLGLSRGDRTGMWMLNYPFPYGSIGVSEAFAAMSSALLEAINCQQGEQSRYLKIFYKARERFKLLLSADDYKYFAFQCWQEGVARYTELRVAELASKDFTPSKEFLLLNDYRPFKEIADSIRSNILGGLEHPALAKSNRVAFYAFGAGEALLLDKLHSAWKQEYLRTKFQLDTYFSK